MVDPDHEAHRLYGAATEALYLVRPDGYIGFRGHPATPEPLLQHLRAIYDHAPAPAQRH